LADLLDHKQPSVNRMPQGDQRVELRDAALGRKVLRVVDHRFRSQRAPLLEVLFERTVLVVDADAGHDPMLEHMGAELTGSPLGHQPIEDQAHPIRTAQVEILTDEALDQRPSLGGVHKHLCPAHFTLPDAQVVLVALGALRRREGPRQLVDPVVEKGLDHLGR